MQNGTSRDIFRKEIISKSIQILQRHGKSEKEIKEMMLKDFSIQEENLDMLLNVKDEQKFKILGSC